MLIIQFCLIVQFIILSLSAETKQLYNVVFCLDINRHDAGSMVRLYSLRIIPRFLFPLKNKYYDLWILFSDYTQENNCKQDYYVFR